MVSSATLRRTRRKRSLRHGRQHRPQHRHPPSRRPAAAPSAHRQVLGAAGDHRDRAVPVHRLLDVARLRERALLDRAPSTATTSRRSTRRAWRQNCPVGRPLVQHQHRPLDLPGALHPDLPAGLPADLLLLPQGLLPRLLAVAAGVRGVRAAQELQRRDAVPVDLQQHPPALPVLRDDLQHHPDLRRLRRLRGFNGRSFGMGLGTARAARQRDAAVALHAVLPLLPAPDRRPHQPLLQAPRALQDVDLRLQAQLQAHGVRLGQPVRRRPHRLLRAPISTGAFTDPRFF